jgi:hypothetical protein
VESSSLTLSAQSTVTDSKITQATNILKETLLILMKLAVPKMWTYVGLTDLRGLQDDIVYKETNLFSPLDVASPNLYLLKDDKLLALATSHSENLSNMSKSQIQGFQDIASSIEVKKT